MPAQLALAADRSIGGVARYHTQPTHELPAGRRDGQLGHSGSPTPSVDEALDELAQERFGPTAARHARKAWTAFSRAFQEYPYSVAVLYNGPLQLGPANLMYAKPTGWRATMVGFPYDDVSSWCPPYPPQVFASQLEKLAAGWEQGLEELRLAVDQTPADKRSAAEAELRYARAARLYFQSAANQTRFILARNALGETAASPADRQQQHDQLRRVLQQEIAIAREMFTLARQDSCIGFEAASQYFYLPLDLVEKAFGCRLIADAPTYRLSVELDSPVKQARAWNKDTLLEWHDRRVEATVSAVHEVIALGY